MSTAEYPDVEDMSRDELEDEVAELRGEVDDLKGTVREQGAILKAMRKKMERVETALAGSSDEFSSWDVGEMDPVNDRLRGVEDTVEDHAGRFEMFVVEDGSNSTPDKRAMHLRQILYNQAKSNDGYASIDRDTCDSALGGGLHRGTVLDAMRRAADGENAKINGSSDLTEVDGVEFRKGTGKDTQSRLILDRDDLTAADVRQNLTTKDA